MIPSSSRVVIASMYSCSGGTSVKDAEAILKEKGGWN